VVFGESDSSTREMRGKVPWHLLLLSAVLALSAFLDLSRLTSEGYANVYYAATVKDMLDSWYNFVFVSYDAGFVSVDKPPLAFWIQAASAYLLGFHGWSLLLPQALAGVLCVALLYHLVGRSFGSVAGLLAALALALTPISVATNRHNNLESLLALTVLLAAWAFILAAQTGRLRWLVVGGLVMGLGFNIKMLEVFLVLPAFYLLYLVAAPVGWRRRMTHLGLATVVTVAASLPWVVAVDLTPADQRPYVGSSSFDTETDLIVGWNGVERVVGNDKGVGDPGPLRFLDPQLAGQIGWLLPLALVGLAVASWQSWKKRPRLPLSRKEDQALLLWGTWLISLVVFFSVAGDWDPYYLEMLAPAVAALVGTGVVALWDDYLSPGWVAFAPDTCGCSQLAVTHTVPLPGLEPLVGAHNRYPVRSCSRKSCSRTPDASVEDQWLSAGRHKRRDTVPVPRPVGLGCLYDVVWCRNSSAERWASDSGQ
jgi:4-amino-4-deoxy-L-arabinose transferase-like glycosyltransferase